MDKVGASPCYVAALVGSAITSAKERLPQEGQVYKGLKHLTRLRHSYPHPHCHQGQWGRELEANLPGSTCGSQNPVLATAWLQEGAVWARILEFNMCCWGARGGVHLNKNKYLSSRCLFKSLSLRGRLLPKPPCFAHWRLFWFHTWSVTTKVSPPSSSGNSWCVCQVPRADPFWNVFDRMAAEESLLHTLWSNNRHQTLCYGYYPRHF